MKNWKIITALILFFPLGLYFMFKHTNWSERSKWTITIIGSFIFGTAFLSEFYYELLVAGGIITSIASITWFIYAIIRRKQKRSAVVALIFGLLLSVYSLDSIADQTAEAERIAYELQVEEERAAEEARLEQIRLAEEQELKEQQELEEKYLGVATNAVEKVENEPTSENYNTAIDLVQDLPNPNEDLEKRLTEIEPVVEDYEAAYSEALEAIELAENNMDRESYETAYALSSALAVSNSTFSNRLTSVDKELTVIEEKLAEEERLAKEKAEQEEAERTAKEKAEQEKLAQEKAAAEEQAAAEKAEAERKAAEAAASSESNQSSGASSAGASNAVAPPAQSSTTNDNVTKLVYIAPQSGTKYHYDENCRGLSNANSVASMSINDAKAQGYTLCGWED